MTGTPSGMSATAAASRSSVQASSITARSLMSFGIDALLEGLDPEPAHRIDEAFVLVAPLDVDIDQPLDDAGHFSGRERRPDHLAQGRMFALIAADGDLVPLLAVLVDAEHANVADVVMAAGVHAAGDVEIDLAQIVDVVEIVEAPLYGFGDRNRFRVGK